VEPVGLFEFIALEDYLSELLGMRVDLVSKRVLKACIGERVLKEVVYA
jgi:predicted nucleotidyltransferase